MTPEQFIDECNKTPLLKKYRLQKGSIFSIDDLKNYDFLRDDYVLEDLKTITQRLTESKDPEVPRDIYDLVIKIRQHKDLAHFKLIQLSENRGMVEQARKDMGFPLDKIKRGFKVVRYPVSILLPSLGNVDFSYCPAFKEWFFSHTMGQQFYDEYDRWQKATSIVYGKIDTSVKKILECWGLTQRYHRAITELIVFNRIIPASSPFSWHAGPDEEGAWIAGINFGTDVTKTEIIDEIQEDPLGYLKNRKKHIKGKIFRTPRKFEETSEMITLYNELKRIGKKDKEIYNLIGGQYPSLTISAIRKRIKGK